MLAAVNARQATAIFALTLLPTFAACSTRGDDGAGETCASAGDPCPRCDYLCTVEIAPRAFRQCGCGCSPGSKVTCSEATCPADAPAPGSTCPAGLVGGIAHCAYGGVDCSCDVDGLWTCTGDHELADAAVDVADDAGDAAGPCGPLPAACSDLVWPSSNLTDAAP
jgi:hypothetical protein